MTFRVLLSMLVLLVAVESVRGDQPLKQDFAELERLHSVLKLPSFPSPTQNGVRFWLQGSVSRGTAKTIDIDEWPLDSTLRFFGVEYSKTLDLKNIAIISDNGLSVRFVDFYPKTLDLNNIAINSDNGLPVRFVDFRFVNFLRNDTVVKRGDVVAFFLLSEQVEARRERRENSADLGDTYPAGILVLHDVDAGSLLPFLNEIRSSCGEPKLTLGVDASKNAIVFRNSTSSTAETIAKLQRWIRNVEPGKLRKR